MALGKSLASCQLRNIAAYVCHSDKESMGDSFMNSKGNAYYGERLGVMFWKSFIILRYYPES